MPPEPIHLSALGIDLSPRVASSSTVAASPAAAAETTIASLTLAQFASVQVVSGVIVLGWAAFTVGTSGTAVTMRIRQTSITGTVVVTTGAVTGGIAATNLVQEDANGFDSGAGVASYFLTLQVTAGAATSTVSAVSLICIWV